MKLFLDANILISVINKEYPLFTYSSRILSLSDGQSFEIFTSPVCLAITFYFAEKKHKRKKARQMIGLLSDHLSITTISSDTVRNAAKNKAINDFEDGLEYYAAKESMCQCIITENINDFYFSDIEVLNCNQFFKKYMVEKTRK